MYFVKKLVAIRCTPSALSLDLFLSLSKAMSWKANVASTVRGILKIAVKVWPLFDHFLTGDKHKCFGVFLRASRAMAMATLALPLPFATSHVCSLQPSLFQSQLYCCLLSAGISSREFFVLWSPPLPPQCFGDLRASVWITVVLHEAFSFSSKEECDLRWRFYGLTMMMMIPGGWWRESSISWFPTILPFSFVFPSLCSRARRPILNIFNNLPTLRIFCSYATGSVRWLTSEERNRSVQNPVTAAG